LSFVNLWDSYLSAALYSGTIPMAEIYTNDSGKDALPREVKPYLVHTSELRLRLRLDEGR